MIVEIYCVITTALWIGYQLPAILIKMIMEKSVKNPWAVGWDIQIGDIWI